MWVGGGLLVVVVFIAVLGGCSCWWSGLMVDRCFRWLSSAVIWVGDGLLPSVVVGGGCFRWSFLLIGVNGWSILVLVGRSCWVSGWMVNCYSW